MRLGLDGPSTSMLATILCPYARDNPTAASNIGLALVVLGAFFAAHTVLIAPKTGETLFGNSFDAWEIGAGTRAPYASHNHALMRHTTARGSVRS